MKKDGVNIEYYDGFPNHKKSEVSYKNGKQNGLYKWFFLNGKTRFEGYFLNNSKEGISNEYTKNGLIYKITNKKGFSHGVHLFIYY